MYGEKVSWVAEIPLRSPGIHSLSHCGVSRRCPPTETFTPNNECSGLGNPPEGFKPVYKALPLPEASAPPVVVGIPKILGHVIRIPYSPVVPHQL